MAMMDNAEESDVNNRRCERSYGPRTLWRVAEDLMVRWPRDLHPILVLPGLLCAMNGLGPC
jgi:hypothetical protein